MEGTRQPRGHASPCVLAAHLRRVSEKHVAPLNILAAKIADATGQGVPMFDPTSGGIHAFALILLESPGPAATAEFGSGIVSPHNNDPTAAHMHQLLGRNHIPLSSVTFWNMVPWWLRAEARTGSFRAPRTTDVEAAAPWLDRLFSLLPDLQIVMTLGRPAQRGLDRYVKGREFRYTTIAAPHPGNRAWNQPMLRAATHAAFASLARLLKDGTPGNHPAQIDYWP